ncbi:MAG TPA: hypothetical protein VKT73_10380 [Xanthobacteraceae bacterium]|nr:hypothetical protein [Xanthobacteraceae bacterium]
MTNAQPNSVNTGSPKILAKDIHTKWDKISDQEAGNVKKSDDLVSLVKAKYSLSQEQAQTDVSAWANGRSF